MSNVPHVPRADRLAAAKEQAAQLRAEQARTAKKHRTIAVAVLAGALAALLGVVMFIFKTADVDLNTARVTPPVVTDRGGILLGAVGVITPTAEQAANPVGAFGDKVVVSVYTDFMCPYCGQFEQTNRTVLEKLRREGKVIVDFHVVSILDQYSQRTAFSTRSASAAFDIAVSAPDAFDAFVSGMYAAQPKENTAGLSDEQIADIASAAGVPDDVTSSLKDGTYHWYAEQATTIARADVPNFATPALLLDGQNLNVDWTQAGALEAAVAQVAADR